MLWTFQGPWMLWTFLDQDFSSNRVFRKRWLAAAASPNDRHSHTISLSCALPGQMPRCCHPGLAGSLCCGYARKKCISRASLLSYIESSILDLVRHAMYAV